MAREKKPITFVEYEVTCKTCGWSAGKFRHGASARRWAVYHKEHSQGSFALGVRAAHDIQVEKREVK